MKPVLTKADFVRRYQAGEFGNRSPTWNTPMEFAEVNYQQGLVHLRNRTAGGETFYNVDPFEALCRWAGMANPLQFYCSAMAPHEHNLLQGEVQQGPWGLYLHYSMVKGLPMRDALVAEAKDAMGLKAKLLLDWAMNDLSRQWLDYLLETYDGHVIEFSSFGVCWGTVENHNTIIWEVRQY